MGEYNGTPLPRDLDVDVGFDEPAGVLEEVITSVTTDPVTAARFVMVKILPPNNWFAFRS